MRLAVLGSGFLIGIFAAGCGTALAQSATAETQAVLERMARAAADYRKSAPNFTCVENVVTTGKHKGKLKARIEFRANIHVTRLPEGGLQETFTLTDYMGKPVAANEHFPIPLYVTGGMSRGAPVFFAADQQRCFHYTLSERRIQFEETVDGQGCESPLSTRGFATLDAAGSE